MDFFHLLFDCEWVRCDDNQSMSFDSTRKPIFCWFSYFVAFSVRFDHISLHQKSRKLPFIRFIVLLMFVQWREKRRNKWFDLDFQTHIKSLEWNKTKWHHQNFIQFLDFFWSTESVCRPKFIFVSVINCQHFSRWRNCLSFRCSHNDIFTFLTYIF